MECLKWNKLIIPRITWVGYWAFVTHIEEWDYLAPPHVFWLQMEEFQTQ